MILRNLIVCIEPYGIDHDHAAFTMRKQLQGPLRAIDFSCRGIVVLLQGNQL